MDSWNTDSIIEMFKECGRIGLDIADNPHAVPKADRTLVTDADKAIENFLSREFDRSEKGVYIIGEETYASKPQQYLADAIKKKAWIIDPIDGTALYAHGIPLWGISIGFSENGVIRDGGIFMPKLGEMLISDSGTAYHAECGPDPAKWDFKNRLRPLNSPKIQYTDGGIVNLSQTMTKHGTFNGPNTVTSLCSCVYSMTALALGKNLAYILGAKIWDSAGSLPALKALGFYGVLQNGADMMSLEINDRIYNLDFSSPKAFSVRGHAVMAPSREISEKIASLCVFAK